MDEIVDALRRMATPPPSETANYESWLEQNDAFEFLAENTRARDFVAYAGLPHLFVHAITVPLRSLDPPDFDDLLRWDGNPSSSWGMTYSLGDPPELYI